MTGTVSVLIEGVLKGRGKLSRHANRSGLPTGGSIFYRATPRIEIRGY